MAATEQYLRLFLTLTQFFSFPLAIKSFTRQLLVAIICPMSLANALSSASHSDKRISKNILFLFIGFSMFLKFRGAHYTLSFSSEQIQNSLGRNPILGVPGEIWQAFILSTVLSLVEIFLKKTLNKYFLLYFSKCNLRFDLSWVLNLSTNYPVFSSLLFSTLFFCQRP